MAMAIAVGIVAGGSPPNIMWPFGSHHRASVPSPRVADDHQMLTTMPPQCER